MRRFFKVKNFFLVSFLAVAGIFSAGAFVINKQVNETPVVEKAEAADDKDHVVTKIYLKLSSSYWGSASAYYSAHIWGGKTDTVWPGVFFNNGNTASGNSEVSVDVTNYVGFKHILIVRWNGGNKSQEWGRWNYYADGASGNPNHTIEANTLNYFVNNAWDSGAGDGNKSSGVSASLNANKDGYVTLKDAGWYLVGKGFKKQGAASYSSAWSVDQGLKCDSTPGTGNAAKWTGVDFDLSSNYDDGGFKLVYYNHDIYGGYLDWDNAKSALSSNTKAKTNGWIDNKTPSDAGTNLVCKTALICNVYLKNDTGDDDAWKIYISQNYDIDVYTYVDGVTTKVRTDEGVSSDSQYNPTRPSVTGYTFSSWKSGSGTGTAWTEGSYLTSAITLYATYTINTYTITYYRVMNGTNMDWWGTETVSANHFQKYSDIEPIDIYGYGFEGWYSDSSCTTGIGANEITGNATVYAKYTSERSNNTYYVGIPSGNCYNNVTYGGVLRVWYSNGTEEIKDAPTQRIYGVTSTNLYLVSIPSDATWFAFHNGLSVGQMQNGHRTVAVGPNTDYNPGSDNLFMCTNKTTTRYDGGETEYLGSWTTCYFQFQSASNSTFTGGLSKVDMSDPSNLSSGNDAELLGYGAKASYYFRVAIVIDGTENFLTTVGTDANTQACTSSSGSNRFKASNLTVNIYLKNNVIYLLDTSDIDSGGYLYISTEDSLTDIKITVQIKNSSGTMVYPFSSDRLSNVTNVAITSTLEFNEITGMIRIPIYNLRGELTPDKTKQDYYAVTFNSNSAVNIPISTTKTDYYMSSLSSTPTTTNASAASVLYAFDAAIENANEKSVCNIDKDTAVKLVGLYDDLSSSEKSTFNGANIITWTSSVGGGKTEIPISSILYQVSHIANDGVSRGSLSLTNLLGGLTGNEDNTITIIIIIASSVSLLSITALSVLLVKKRKAKQD